MFDKLKEIILFTALPDNILERVIPFLKEETFSDGTIVFKEGEMGEDIYFISSGEVEINKFVNMEKAEYQTISLLGKGEFFGEMSLIDKRCRSASAQAKGEATLFKLSYDDFRHFLDTDTDIALKILGSMLAVTVSRLREIDNEFITIYETGKIIAVEENFRQIVKFVLDKVMESINFAERGFIAIWNEFNEIFEVQSFRGFQDLEIKDLVLTEDDPVIKWLVEHKERLVINDSTASNLIKEAKPQSYYGLSIIAQPFIHLGELLGFVILSNNSRKNAFTRSQINLLSGIAGQIAPSIVNAKKREEEKNRQRLEQQRMQYKGEKRR